MSLKKINAKNKAVLFIGDYHAPYNHIDYLDFLKAVKQKIKAKIIISMGDEVDGHRISFHQSDESLPSANKELELAIEEMKRIEKVFPKMLLLDSNHGSLVYRRLKFHGIPLEHLRPLKDVYDTPKWNWHEEILISTKLGDVYLCHGKSGAYNKLSREIGVSTVQGHFHSKFEITWSHSVFHERFSMFTGCGVDRKSLAMAYGKNHIPQPILGCGALDEQGNPILFKMHLNARNRWTGNL